MQIIMESVFNVAYLIVIWILVVLMSVQMKRVASQDRRLAELIRLAFLLLAFGDTGHVGFRVLAYLKGGLETRINLLGTPMNLAGLGSLTTGVTVTLFYMVMVYVWLVRFERYENLASMALLLAGVVRLFLLALPHNDWNVPTAPYPMGLYRNIPLMVQGVGLLLLIWHDSYRRQDRTFQWIGWMIALSYLFYTPVILWVHRVPALGMLMIPKTCAYLALAWIAYRALWVQRASASAQAYAQSDSKVRDPLPG